METHYRATKCGTGHELMNLTILNMFIPLAGKKNFVAGEKSNLEDSYRGFTVFMVVSKLSNLKRLYNCSGFMGYTAVVRRYTGCCLLSVSMTSIVKLGSDCKQVQLPLKRAASYSISMFLSRFITMFVAF